MNEEKLSFKVEIRCNRTLADVQRTSLSVQKDVAEDLLGRVIDQLTDLGFNLTALADAVEVLATGCRSAARAELH